jgi:hypothetical protein
MFDNRHRHASLVGGPEKREFADLISNKEEKTVYFKKHYKNKCLEKMLEIM